MPGVYDVITSKDVPGANDFSYYNWPEQLMADNKVCHRAESTTT